MRPGVFCGEAPLDEFVGEEFLGAGDGGGGGLFRAQEGECLGDGLEALRHLRIAVGTARDVESVSQGGGDTCGQRECYWKELGQDCARL